MGFIKQAFEESMHVLQKSQPDLITDNTSLDNFVLCPRKYLYSEILKIQPAKEGHALTFGSAFHAALEKYYAGKTKEEVKTTFLQECLKERSQISKTMQEAVENEQRHYEHSMEFGLAHLNRYIDYWPLEVELFQPVTSSDGEPYLEVGFMLDLDVGLLVGKFDGLFEAKKKQERKLVFETKTTTKTLNQNYFRGFNPNNQVSTYLAAASTLLEFPVQECIINAIRVKDFARGELEEQNSKLFGRIITRRNANQLAQSIKQMKFLMLHIKECIERGFDAFRMNAPTACNAHFVPCEFLPLCQAQTEDVVEMLLTPGGEYTKRDWQPYDIMENKDELVEVKL